MNIEDVMIAIAVGGIGVSVAYIRAEFVLWRELGAAERRRGIIAQELHSARLSGQAAADLSPSASMEGEGANTDEFANAMIERRARSESASQRHDAFVERRRSSRQRDSIGA